MDDTEVRARSWRPTEHATLHIVSAEFHDDETFSLRFRDVHPPIRVGAGRYELMRADCVGTFAIVHAQQAAEELTALRENVTALETERAESSELITELRAEVERLRALESSKPTASEAEIRADIAKMLREKATYFATGMCSGRSFEANRECAAEMEVAAQQIERLLTQPSQSSKPETSVSKAEMKALLVRATVAAFRSAAEEGAMPSDYFNGYQRGAHALRNAMLAVIDSLPDAPAGKPWKAYVLRLHRHGTFVGPTLRAVVEHAGKVSMPYQEDVYRYDERDPRGVVVLNGKYSRPAPDGDGREWLPAEQIGEE